MAKVNTLVSAFTSGEISPKLYGRSDIEVYNSSAKKLENIFVQEQGGATRRDGTIYVAEVSDNTKKSRAIPFLQSDLFSYVVELSDLKMRFYYNHAQVREGVKTITAITAASPAVVTSAAHGYTNGDTVYIAAVVGMTELNQRWFVVANKTTNTFELTGEDSSAYTAYASAGTADKVVEITTTYVEADLNTIQFAQDTDTMYIVHPSYPTRCLTRSDHTVWAITDCTFLDGPYLPLNTTTTTLACAATTGTGQTVTASSIVGINGGTGFASTDVGRFIRIQSSSAYGYGVVTAFTDTTHVDIDIITDLDGTVAATTWRLGSFSETTGYPGAVVFYEQRLMLAHTTSQPATIWGSVTADFLNHEPGALSSDPLDYTIADRSVNDVRWLATAAGELFGGAADGIWSLSADSPPLTPANTFVRKQVAEGVAHIPPIEVHNSVLFVRRGQRGLHKLGFDSTTTRISWKSTDVSLLSEHLATTNTNFRQVAWQQDDTRAWVLTGNGKLATYTNNPAAGVTAWTEVTTNGEFESVTVVPNYGTGGDSRDEVWVTVKRTINGVTKRFMEYFSPNVDTDCASYVSSLSAATMTGLVHLNGESVKIRADGALVPDKTVALGVVALGATYTAVEAGLGYTHKIHMLPYEVGAQSGTGQSARKRSYNVRLRLLESLGGTINGDPIIYRSTSDNMGEAVPRFSGWKEMSVDSSYDSDPLMEIEGSEPLDFTVTAIVQRIIVGDS